jgi:DEAD/DEAH box helicase domain-containing protein
MRVVTFDIETANAFPNLARSDQARMDISVVGIHDSETGELSCYTKEEFHKLWPIIERADMLVGYNSDFFDIPILNRYYPGDLSKIKSLDLLVEVHNVLGRRLRLQSIAEATLGVGKSGHGLQAVEWWQNGEVEKVKKYCMDDVKITRDIFDHAIKHGKLKYKELGGDREFKIDTAHWTKVDGSASITHTLPL